jgi:hypothetical protein
MRSPLPSKLTFKNLGRADMLCLSIHGRLVPKADMRDEVGDMVRSITPR